MYDEEELSFYSHLRAYFLYLHTHVKGTFTVGLVSNDGISVRWKTKIIL